MIRQAIVVAGVILIAVGLFGLQGPLRLHLNGVTTPARIVRVNGETAIYEFADVAEPDETYVGKTARLKGIAVGDWIEIRYLRSNPDLSRPVGKWPVIPLIVLILGIAAAVVGLTFVRFVTRR